MEGARAVVVKAVEREGRKCTFPWRGRDILALKIYIGISVHTTTLLCAYLHVIALFYGPELALGCTAPEKLTRRLGKTKLM